MIRGDGVRRNIAHMDDDEVDALIKPKSGSG